MRFIARIATKAAVAHLVADFKLMLLTVERKQFAENLTPASFAIELSRCDVILHEYRCPTVTTCRMRCREGANRLSHHDAKPFSPSIARRRNADALMPSAWALSLSRACSLVESRSSMVVFFVSRFLGFGTVTGQ